MTGNAETMAWYIANKVRAEQQLLEQANVIARLERELERADLVIDRMGDEMAEVRKRLGVDDDADVFARIDAVLVMAERGAYREARDGDG